jgi:hypothetical protein
MQPVYEERSPSFPGFGENMGIKAIYLFPAVWHLACRSQADRLVPPHGVDASAWIAGASSFGTALED